MSDTALADNPRAVIGGNAPPLTPFEIAEKKINDVYDECKLWLDGATVDSQGLADGIGNLLVLIRDAESFADATRVAEKKPYDEKIAEIQARYAPLIANTKAIKGKTVLAAEACKRALQPWLVKKDAEIKEAARLAREEADRQQQAAQEAIRSVDQTNLTARAEAEALVADAKKATVVANKAERQTAVVGGAMGRAVGLRSVWVAAMTDMREAAKHYWTAAPEAMREFLQGQADTDVRNGKRSIPGFEITEQRKTV